MSQNTSSHFNNLKVKILLLILSISLFAPLSYAQALWASSDPGIWKYQCIDTMKQSRDSARSWKDRSDLKQIIERELDIIVSLGANCVAVGTPYDEEFWPLIRMWTDRAHSRNLSVWFRGNMSGWEGWFKYPRYTSVQQHHDGMRKFILANAKYFQGRDLLTPSPEPENGHLMGNGNPWSKPGLTTALANFVLASQDNCEKALRDAGGRASCGFFGSNGYVAERVYNERIANETGNVIVVDHYVDTSKEFIKDFKTIADLHNTNVFAGEFGSYIPSINGVQSEAEQAQLVEEFLKAMYVNKKIFTGLNYWVLRGGTTALLRDDFTEKPVAKVLRRYFKPATLKGRVTDSKGKAVAGATVRLQDNSNSTRTASDGTYSMLVPFNSLELIVEASGKGSRSNTVTNLPSGHTRTINFEF